MGRHNTNGVRTEEAVLQHWEIGTFGEEGAKQLILTQRHKHLFLISS